MLKLYKRNGAVLRYHEAWLEGATVIEHWGVVGERGTTSEHPIPNGKSHDDAVRSILGPAMNDGFRPIDDHQRLLIEYVVNGMGTSSDLDKRHALEERMNETLGWTGLGHCDGGSIGSGTMEVCCFVVDFSIAKSVIETDLAGTHYSDFTRIYDEDA